ncbi:MAG: hypothetical protein JWP85_2549 [Rhodoglobus sp.]|nr:hypothetical protein [Rhodoglobus sp.]
MTIEVALKATAPKKGEALKNRIKRGLLLAIATTGVFAVTACSGATPTPEATETEDLRGQTIKVLVSSGHQQFNDVWLTELPKFEAETGITVELDKVNTTDISSTFLRDVTVGGCTIDNVEMLDGGTAAAAPRMADLGTFLEADGSSADELLKGQVGFAQTAYTFDDKLAFYPFYSGAKGVAYRQSWFEDPANQAAFKAAYGYDLPNPPTTQDQIVDLAEFFTTPTTTGIVFSGAGDPGESTIDDLIFRQGVDGFQDENNNAQWGPAHPENIKKVTEAATYLTDFITNGYTPASIAAMQTADTTANFLAGNTAMDYDHVYLAWNQMVAAEATLGEIGSFEFPSAEKGNGGISFYWGRGIPECSQHKAASWEFMKWVMSDDIQKNALTKGVGVYVPTNVELLAWAVDQGIVPQGVADSVAHAQAYKVTPVTAQLRQSIGIPAYEKLIGKQLTPKEYAEALGNQMQDAANAAGITK